MCQNEDSLHSFPDDMSDDLTQPAKIGRGRGGRRDRRHKKLDAQVGQLSCMLPLRAKYVMYKRELTIKKAERRVKSYLLLQLSGTNHATSQAVGGNG